MSIFRSLILAAVILAAPVSLLLTPTSAEARQLPVHCGDLLDGDCDVPWQCVLLCFMELLAQTEFCAQYPTDPQCV